MKKILIGTFITESNANIPVKNEITSYDIQFGDDLIEKMGTTLSAATRLPMRYVYLAFTVGAVLMIIAFLKLIPTKGKEILNGISSEAELEDGGEKKQIEKEGENQ